MIVVQEISVTWTKLSRGGQNAHLRNQVKEGFALPAIPKPEAANTLIRHTIKVDEAEQFDAERNQRVEVQEFSLTKKPMVGAVRLTLTEDKLAAIYTYSPSSVGAPARDPRAKTVLILTPGTWGRIVYNGRFGWDSEWWYRKTVLNIGYFDEAPKKVFLEKPPHLFTDLANLL